jgi:hypothetical protein
MAKNQTARVRPDTLQADQNAYTALLAIGDYTPVNEDFSRENVSRYFDVFQVARQTEVNAENALDAARDNATAAEWGFHNAMLGVKAQVIAQFGADSNEAQAMGLVKKSERKAPTRKTTTAA